MEVKPNFYKPLNLEIMKEDLISFETAKLAKEKGFDGFCFDAYNTHKFQYSNGWLEYIDDNEIAIPFTSKALKPKDILAPTQSLLQKWLREVHRIYLCIKPIHNLDINGSMLDNWEICIEDFTGRNFLEEPIYIHGHEEALEAGLYQALKLIKL